MENEVTEKMMLFLQNLRCEDADRETLVHLAGSKREKENLGKLRIEYEKRIIDVCRIGLKDEAEIDKQEGYCSY